MRTTCEDLGSVTMFYTEFSDRQIEYTEILQDRPLTLIDLDIERELVGLEIVVLRSDLS